jgi:predicted DNA-binding transcriptional regulator AlpA
VDGKAALNVRHITTWTDIMTRNLRKAQVAARLGNVATRTIDRWTADEKLGFPQPLYIGVTPLWDEAELEAWKRDRPKIRPATGTGSSKSRSAQCEQQREEEGIERTDGRVFNEMNARSSRVKGHCTSGERSIPKTR